MKTTLLIISLGFCSFLLTYIIRYFAFRKKIVSIPNERSLHVVPTPLGGGLAIVITWYIGISILFFSGLIEKGLYFALLSGVLLTIVSFIDDLVGLKPFIRLCFHFATAISAFIFLGGLRQIITPGIDLNYIFLIYPLAVVGMVWFINLFNFMDGVDGFASLEAVTICLIMYFLSGSIINILLVACISGFIFWNWPKAKIFMGDVGSTQLGFILVVLGIYFHNNYQFSILNWIMLSSPFWFDATFTLFRRWRNGEKLSEAHRKHAYQRIVQAGFSHLQVDLCLIIINVFIVVMILIYREIKFLQIPLFLITLLLLYLITKQVDRRVPFGKGKGDRGIME
ncbi:MAG: glycosyltransferase family 4 protein [Bacteroidales bacterium]|nr:glycosyltransferase family 4 protein [Bacteroidales bacterium]